MRLQFYFCYNNNIFTSKSSIFTNRILFFHNCCKQQQQHLAQQITEIYIFFSTATNSSYECERYISFSFIQLSIDPFLFFACLIQNDEIFRDFASIITFFDFIAVNCFDGGSTPFFYLQYLTYI